MYKIEAVIFRTGSMPVNWVRYTDKPMTLKQCNIFLTAVKSNPKNAIYFPDIDVRDFSCTKV